VIPKSAACGALPDAVNLLAGSLLFLIGTIWSRLCSTYDALPAVDPARIPCSNDAVNVGGALGLTQNRVVGFPRPTRCEPHWH
jgi:hypothetical protein